MRCSVATRAASIPHHVQNEEPASSTRETGETVSQLQQHGFETNTWNQIMNNRIPFQTHANENNLATRRAGTKPLPTRAGPNVPASLTSQTPPAPQNFFVRPFMPLLMSLTLLQQGLDSTIIPPMLFHVLTSLVTAHHF